MVASLKEKKISLLLSLIIISAAVFISYSNSFNNSFQFDDVHFIQQNSIIKSFDSFKDISFWFDFGNRAPAQYLLAINYAAGEYSVKGYHLLNTLIHLLTSIGVYFFAGMVLSSRSVKNEYILKNSGSIRLFSALIFAVHPIQTESVTYIVQRMESLSALFYFTALIFYLMLRKENKKGKRIVLALIFLAVSVLACLTKQTSYTLPLSVLLLEIYFVRDNEDRMNKILVGFISSVLLLLVFIGLAADILPKDQMAELSRYDYLITQFKVIPNYFRLLILPLGQNIDHDITTAVSLSEFGVLAGLIFIILMTAAAYFLYRKEHLILSFSIAWVFAVISLRSSILPISDLMTERRLYAAVFGAGLFIPSALFYLKERFRSSVKPNTVIAVLTVITLLLAFATVSRNKVWSNELTLWKDSVEKSPHKFRPNYNTAEAYKRSGDADSALKFYFEAYKINSQSYGLCNNIANIFSGKKMWNEAESFYKKALVLKPDYTKAILNLGNLYYMTARYDMAVLSYRKVLHYEPDNLQAKNNLEAIIAAGGE
ncbi:MAG TPA: hypothetical protein PKW56_10260, partial [Clostridiales bacterium]|nr:hypothetical protein [Clostridiales bacterium]